MSWIQKLHETYERCYGARQFERNPLNPVSSQYLATQIQITIDGAGNFRRAELLELPNTLIPVSEESASRSGNDPSPNPLTDKLGYCGADIGEYDGDNKRYEGYERQLRVWCSSEFADPKACAVLHYVEKKTLVGDLIRGNVLKCESGRLVRLKISAMKIIEAKDAWIRWRVEIPGDHEANTWNDEGLFQRWAGFESSKKSERGMCFVTGKTSRVARLHPRAIRGNGDRAKLITSNDKTGFTFRGKFGAAEQAAAVGYEVTQKAHNALRWLIARQGYHDRATGQVFVAWSVSGKRIPDPFEDTARLFEVAGVGNTEQNPEYVGDAGQHFALRLKKAISGYRAELGDADDVVVIGLDSATPGRMAITYYRELTGSEFLGRVSEWHARCSWSQHYSKDVQFLGAPAPREIAEAAYGPRLDDKLRNAAMERLLPSIVDACPLPHDIVEASVHRACSRAGIKKWKWEKCLGIACALVRGSTKEENYQMSLEENRTTRDYLFGRLLAIADNIEQRALHLAKENRDTNAAKLMQRFADHPCSTWRSIEGALTPYKTRLRAKRPAVLLERDKLLDTVMGMFSREDFISDNKLSGEFLLGYHCQRAALWPKGKPDGGSPDKDEPAVEGETI